MDDYNQGDKNNFIYHVYLGKFTPQSFVFNAYLQEFSRRVYDISKNDVGWVERSATQLIIRMLGYAKRRRLGGAQPN